MADSSQTHESLQCTVRPTQATEHEEPKALGSNYRVLANAEFRNDQVERAPRRFKLGFGNGLAEAEASIACKFGDSS